MARRRHGPGSDTTAASTPVPKTAKSPAKKVSRGGRAIKRGLYKRVHMLMAVPALILLILGTGLLPLHRWLVDPHLMRHCHPGWGYLVLAGLALFPVAALAIHASMVRRSVTFVRLLYAGTVVGALLPTFLFIALAAHQSGRLLLQMPLKGHEEDIPQLIQMMNWTMGLLGGALGLLLLLGVALALSVVQRTGKGESNAADAGVMVENESSASSSDEDEEDAPRFRPEAVDLFQNA